mgnify:CR=1 FL=1
MDSGSLELLPDSRYNQDNAFLTSNYSTSTDVFVVNETLQFKMAAGNAGVEAATNIVIREAQTKMLLWVYGVVIALCLSNFRSLRITVCIIVPLMLTSVLGQALMVALGIGVKVATLPVIALGAGIGVDYGIYIYSSLQNYLHSSETLETAYFRALFFLPALAWLLSPKEKVANA